MKHLSRLVGLVLVFALLTTLTATVFAQEEGGAGEGGIIFQSNIGDDPRTFNPLLGNDTTSSSIYDRLYPSIIAINPQTGLEEPNVAQGLATGWEYDETGTILTVFLREDAFWNDGTQITAHDYIWAANAIQSGETSSPRTGMFVELADGTPAGGHILSVEALDDFTVEVVFDQADCISFSDVNDATPVPSHIWEELFGDNLAAMDEDLRAIPEVTWGPWQSLEIEPGQRTSMLSDQAFPDTVLGYVSPSEWVLLSTGDTNVATEMFKAQELTIFGIPLERQNEFRTDEFSDFQFFEFTGNGFDYVAMNSADPANPLDGLDEDGNIIEQVPHPVFGDVLVRRAVTHAVPQDDIIEGIKDGNAVPVATHTIPTSWVFNEDLQYTYDLDAARALLDEAGWVDDDGDESTPRVCQGCLYATQVDESFEGSTLSVGINYNEGNEARSQIAEFFQAELAKVGFDVTVNALDWSSAYIPELLGQSFDLTVLGWSLGLPVNPDISGFYYPEVDLVGAGFNFTSYYNPELIELNDAAGAVPGCDIDERRDLYLQVQQILFDDPPYYYISVSKSLTGAVPGLENWNPTPFSRTWDEDGWDIALDSE